RDRAVLHVRDELARPLDGSVDTPGQQLGRSTPLAIGDVDDLDAELLEQGSSSQVRERTKARYTYLERLALGLGSLGHRVTAGRARRRADRQHRHLPANARDRRESRAIERNIALVVDGRDRV